MAITEFVKKCENWAKTGDLASVRVAGNKAVLVTAKGNKIILNVDRENRDLLLKLGLPENPQAKGDGE